MSEKDLMNSFMQDSEQQLHVIANAQSVCLTEGLSAASGHELHSLQGGRLKYLDVL